jgi:hypothetical protein
MVSDDQGDSQLRRSQPATNLDRASATLNDGSAKKYLDGGDEIEL